MNSISIIVPNLHSPIIDQTLASLCQQDYEGLYDITVVGQDRYGLIQENDIVKAIYTPEPVIQSISRNIGIRETKGEILAFIDSDCLASQQWLSRLARYYTDSDVNVVGGSVTFPTENYWTWCDNVATFHEYMTSTKPGIRQQLPSLNLSIRRSALNLVGLFNEDLAIAEDVDLTIRLRQKGYKLHFDPTAEVIHLPQRHTIISILKHAYNFGQNTMKLDPRYQDILKWPNYLKRWWTLLLFSPILSAGVIYQIIVNERIGSKHWITLPVVYLTKLAWCFGASHKQWID